MKAINMLMGFLIGENSKKRSIAIVLGLIVIGANMLGYISNEVTGHLLGLVGLGFCAAVGAKLTKMHQAIKK